MFCMFSHSHIQCLIGHVSYIRISLMLFLFPVKDGKLSTGVNVQRFLSCYGYF